MRRVVHLRRSQDGMGERIVKGGRVVLCPHDHILGVARDDRVHAVQLFQRVLRISSKQQGRSSVAIKGIELRQRTVVQCAVAAQDIQTSPEGIRQLTVLQRHLRIHGTQSCPLTVMHRHVPHGKLLSVNRCRVAHNPVERTMHIRIFQYIIIRTLVDMNALPLSAHHVIRQVVEHPVHPVAPQHHIRLGRTLRHQSSVHLQSAVPMEINGLPCRYP